jgi:hypothetical protein
MADGWDVAGLLRRVVAHSVGGEAACWRDAPAFLHMPAARPETCRCVVACARVGCAHAREAGSGGGALWCAALDLGYVPVLCVSLAACEVNWKAMIRCA